MESMGTLAVKPAISKTTKFRNHAKFCDCDGLSYVRATAVDLIPERDAD